MGKRESKEAWAFLLPSGRSAVWSAETVLGQGLRPWPLRPWWADPIFLGSGPRSWFISLSNSLIFGCYPFRRTNTSSSSPGSSWCVFKYVFIDFSGGMPSWVVLSFPGSLEEVPEVGQRGQRTQEFQEDRLPTHVSCSFQWGCLSRKQSLAGCGTYTPHKGWRDHCPASRGLPGELHDILRDDILLYKKCLEDQGVPVTWYHVEDGFQGSLILCDWKPFSFPCSLKIVTAIVSCIKSTL